MARLTFPEQQDIFVYYGPGEPIRQSGEIGLYVYLDAECTTKASIADVDENPISGSLIFVQPDGLIPLFLGPDGAQELYLKGTETEPRRVEAAYTERLAEAVAAGEETREYVDEQVATRTTPSQVADQVSALRTEIQGGSVDAALDTIKKLADALLQDRDSLDALESALDLKIDVSARGAASGVAPLVGSKVPDANLPDRLQSAALSAATSAAISTAVDGLVSGAPGALDTLKELADALGDDANFASTVMTSLGAIRGATDPALRTSLDLIYAHINTSGALVVGDQSVAPTLTEKQNDPGIFQSTNYGDAIRDIVGRDIEDSTSNIGSALVTMFASLLGDVVTVSTGGALALGKATKVNASSAPRTMTLPDAAFRGQVVYAEKTDSSANAVTINGKIRGTSPASISLNYQYETIMFVGQSNGSWEPLAGHRTKSSIDAQIAAAGGSGAPGGSGVATPSFRGPWAPSTAYLANDLVVMPNSDGPAAVAGGLGSASVDQTGGYAGEIMYAALAHTSEASYAAMDRRNWKQWPPASAKPRTARDRWVSTGVVLATRFDDATQLAAIFQDASAYTVGIDPGGRAAAQLTATGTRGDLRSKVLFGESFEGYLRYRPPATIGNYHPFLTYGTDPNNEMICEYRSASGNPIINVTGKYKGGSTTTYAGITGQPTTADLTADDRIIKFRKLGNVFQMKNFKATDREPDWYTYLTGASGPFQNFGYLGVGSQYSQDWLLELVVTGLKRENSDGNIVWNSDLTMQTNIGSGAAGGPSAIGMPCWWFPAQANGHSVEVIADRYGKMRPALKWTDPGLYGAGQWTQDIKGLFNFGESQSNVGGQLRGWPWVDGFPPDLEISIWTKGVGVTYDDTNSHGPCCDFYYYDRYYGAQNAGGQTGYKTGVYYPRVGPRFGPFPHVDGPHLTDWDWWETKWVLPVNEWWAIRNLQMQIVTHTVLMGQLWIQDPCLRPVASRVAG